MTQSPAAIPVVTLNDGNTLPVIGLGVGELSESETEQSVSAALEAGYRLIDTASAYGNEAAVGRAIASSGIPREEVFVTTKLATSDQGFKASQDALKASLERLGLDYVDLYLIHWPAGNPGKYVDSWGGLMKRKELGDAKSIGLANFHAEDLSNVIDLSFFTPAVNQIELHPLLNQAELRATNAEYGIVTEAYGPLGVGALLDNADHRIRGTGTWQNAGPGAHQVEHSARQHRHSALVVTGADQVEYRRVRLRAERRRHGHPQWAERRHPLPTRPRDIHGHLASVRTLADASHTSSEFRSPISVPGAPALQKGSRNSRFSTLPAPDSGSDVLRNSTERGHL